MIPSTYQQAFYDFVSSGKGNGQGKALAGSGKTTTALQSLKHIDKKASAIFLAFNKSIATELQSKVPFNVEASTLHSFGYAAIRDTWGNVRVEAKKVDNILKYHLFNLNNPRDKGQYWQNRNTMLRVISLLKSEGFISPTSDDVQTVIRAYDLDTVADGIVETILKAFDYSVENTEEIDFDDMIYYPAVHDIKVKQKDWVFVDELQDLNTSQMQLLFKIRKPNTRIIGIGDEHQSIYHFRGANADAMGYFAQELQTTALPLNICYRCSKSVITKAQTYVPEIEAWDQSPEGIVSNVKMDAYKKAVATGDFVLCRVTEPLVRECLGMIREGRKATVKGRDIGQNLNEIVDKIDKQDGAGFFDKCESYRAVETERLLRTNREEAVDSLNDRVDTIEVLLESAAKPDPWSVKAKINEIFKDEVQGIAYMTIHKSKGLEADRVYILPAKSKPPKSEVAKTQEKNLAYVACTRAKAELYYVESK
jgi:DNA helicase-2/ATP-dependent DNA helicase PcrA